METINMSKKDLSASGMRPMNDRVRSCKYYMTSRGVKKMQDVASRVKKHFSDLWSGRNKK